MCFRFACIAWPPLVVSARLFVWFGCFGFSLDRARQSMDGMYGTGSRKRGYQNGKKNAAFGLYSGGVNMKKKNGEVATDFITYPVRPSAL